MGDRFPLPLPLPRPPSRKGRGTLAASAALLLSAWPALGQQAAAPTWKQLTVKELAAKCHATDAGARAACVGYVEGIYDLQFAPTPPRGVCPPDNFTPELLAEVVTAYADTHDDGPAPPAVGQAIVRFFPCTDQHR